MRYDRQTHFLGKKQRTCINGSVSRTAGEQPAPCHRLQSADTTIERLLPCPTSRTTLYSFLSGRDRRPKVLFFCCYSSACGVPLLFHACVRRRNLLEANSGTLKTSSKTTCRILVLNSTHIGAARTPAEYRLAALNGISDRGRPVPRELWPWPTVLMSILQQDAPPFAR